VAAKAIGYVRVSSVGQLDGYGLGVQTEDIRRCAKAYGLKLIRIESDEGVPGTLEAVDRPGLATALAALESGDAEILLVPRLDRLARKLTIQEAALAHVWRHAGRVIACDQGEISHDDPDDPMRTAMRQMMGVFAQLDRGMTVARLRRGRLAKAAAGGYAHGRPAFGYQSQNGRLVPVEEEQLVIRRARALHAEGRSLREIADTLGREGRRPRGGGRWHPPQVARLLEYGLTKVAK
jgi:DNA invertase Pin-like site-specific DNA recombinase